MKEGWTYKKLGEICDLYQPKTISSDMLVSDGDYLVYGANGIIGRYNQYNHEASEVLVTCRGATCGTINISKPFSWINGNAMVVHPKSENLCKRYLVFALRGIDMSDVITGAAQPQITRQSLTPKKLPVPPLSEQQRIVSELDLLSSIIEKKKAQLKEYDQLAQSIFYDMFGDPVTNEKGWEVKRLGDEFEVSSGGTPSTKKSEYWDDGDISWIGSNMCQNQILFKNDGKFITKDGYEHSSAKMYKKGFVLVALVGATIGKVALLNFDTTTNQNIAGINVPSNKDFDPIFVFYLIQSLYCFFENIGDGKFKMANLSFVRSLPIIKPSYEFQQSFASKIEAIERQKALIQQSITEAETLFNSRMDYYFN